MQITIGLGKNALSGNEYGRLSIGLDPRDGAHLPKLSAVLKAASKRFDDVVRAGVFLTNMTDFAVMNGIYAKYSR